MWERVKTPPIILTGLLNVSYSGHLRWRMAVGAIGIVVSVQKSGGVYYN
jgi:hypothetical protein